MIYKLLQAIYLEHKARTDHSFGFYENSECENQDLTFTCDICMCLSEAKEKMEKGGLG